ncbi:MAG: 50S ribosomal protein L14e [Candidatus Bathyarchaeota archaeon]|nr:MAG: 50S ribosomal protein L14e [Candidatus Bathyarchaeota archaeon]
MSVYDIGRVCVKTTGREANRKCVVVEIIDKSFALITGPRGLSGVKRRRANINHLKPLNEKLAISRGASDEEIMVAIQKEGLTNEMQSQATG